MKYVSLFRYDPERDPTARLRLEYDSDWGNATLSDENTHIEQVENPDALHLDVLASMQLTTAQVKWLHEKTGELARQMADCDAKAQAKVDRILRSAKP